MSDKVIMFTDNETQEEVAFEVIEETKVNNISYLLVAEVVDEEETGDALILKDMLNPEDAEASYEIVSDDIELQSIAKIFEELLGDDTEIE